MEHGGRHRNMPPYFSYREQGRSRRTIPWAKQYYMGYTKSWYRSRGIYGGPFTNEQVYREIRRLKAGGAKHMGDLGVFVWYTVLGWA